MTLSAFAVYDAIGVRAKPNDSLYRNFKWQALITDELGIKHTRGSIGHSKSDFQYMKPLFDKGVKHCATIVQSANGLNWTDAQANINGIRDIWGPNNISGIEGPNEYNNGEPTGWAQAERDFVKKAHDYVRSIPALAPCNLVAPSIYRRIAADYVALGSLDAWVDRGCLHYYTGVKKPTVSAYPIDKCISDAHILTPKSLWVTEVGYDLSQGLSQRQQAKYMLRVMLELIKRGVERTYIFELFDTMSGHQYGLLTSTLGKRLAFYAVKNLVALVKDAPCVASPLDVRFSGPSDLVTMVVGKSDGSHLVLMWRDVLSKDADVSASVAVAFPAAKTVEVYQPTFDAAVKQTASGSSLTLQVPDHVVVLKVMA